MRSNYACLTLDELILEYIRISLEQYEALRYQRTSAYNRLYDLTKAIEDELKARVGDQRRRLVKLYDHSNVQVRLKAAIATRSINREGAVRVLQSIKGGREYPFVAYAADALNALDDGRYVPD